MTHRTPGRPKIELEVCSVPATRNREPEPYPETETIFALLSQVTRRGEWEPPERMRVFACMGRAVLDFRKAVLPPGITEVQAFSLLGSVKIIVPPELDVEINGNALLGRLGHKTLRGGVKRIIKDWLGTGEPEPDPDEEGPLLQITANAVLGDVSLRVM